MIVVDTSEGLIEYALASNATHTVWGASGFVDSPVSYSWEACLVSNSVGDR